MWLSLKKDDKTLDPIMNALLLLSDLHFHEVKPQNNELGNNTSIDSSIFYTKFRESIEKCFHNSKDGVLVSSTWLKKIGANS